MIGTVALSACLGCTGCLGSTASAISGPVTVTFWHSQEGAAGELLEQLAAEFSQAEPNITVDPVFRGPSEDMAAGLLEAAREGEGPVLAEVPETALPSLRTAGVLMPLQTYIANREFGLALADQDDFWPFLVETNTTGRVAWGLPFSHQAYALIYNPDLVPEAPQTREQLLDLAASLTRRDPDPAHSTFGLALTADAGLFSVFLAQDGGHLLAGDPPVWSFNDPAGVAALYYLYELASLRKCVLVTMGDPAEAVADGRAAMAIDCLGWPGSSLSAPGETPLAVAPLPSGNLPAALAPGTSLVLGSGHSAAEQEAAWRFMRWLTDKEQALRWATGTGNVPVRRSVLSRRLWLSGPGRDSGWAAVVSSLGAAVSPPDVTGWAQVEEKLRVAVSRCLFGQTISLQLLLDGAAAGPILAPPGN